MGILAAYFVFVIAITMMFTKRSETKEDFLVGNRTIGALSIGLSIAATWIWAPALFVSAEKAYLNGIPGLFWFTIPNVLCLIFFIPFAKKIRKVAPSGVTLSGYMNRIYGSRVKGIYLVQLVGLAILSTAVQLLAGGKILSAITGHSLLTISIILAVIAYSYSQFSGIKASVITDALQMVFIFLACLLLMPWAVRLNGGIATVVDGLGGISKEYGRLFDIKGLEVFFAFGLPTTIGLISGPFGDQCFWQRAFSVKENKIAKAFIIGALAFAVVPLSMGVLGFVAAGAGFEAFDSGLVNFELVTKLFPQWVLVPFVFMILSGLLSTIDSNLCAISSLTTDIFKNTTLGIYKGSMALLLIAGIAIASIPGLSVTHLFLFYGTLRATTLLPTMLTLMGRKLSARGVYAGVVASMIVALPIFAYGTINNISLLKTVGSVAAVMISGCIAATGAKQEEANLT